MAFASPASHAAATSRASWEAVTARVSRPSASARAHSCVCLSDRNVNKTELRSVASSRPIPVRAARARASGARAAATGRALRRPRRNCHSAPVTRGTTATCVSSASALRAATHTARAIRATDSVSVTRCGLRQEAVRTRASRASVLRTYAATESPMSTAPTATAMRAGPRTAAAIVPLSSARSSSRPIKAKSPACNQRLSVPTRTASSRRTSSSALITGAASTRARRASSTQRRASARASAPTTSSTNRVTASVSRCATDSRRASWASQLSATAQG